MFLYSKLRQWYFSKGSLPYWSVLAIDCMFVVFSGIIAFMARHGTVATGNYFLPLLGTLGISLVCFLVGFRIFHTYMGVIRLSSFSDLVRIASAVILGVCLVFVVQWACSYSDNLVELETTDIILMGLFSIAFMWTLRVWTKSLYDEFINPYGYENVFILAGKDDAAAMAKSMNASADIPYRVRGFVMNDPSMRHRYLMGKSVFQLDSDFVGRMEMENTSILMVSPQMMDVLRHDEGLVDNLVSNGIKLLVTPKAQEWDGKSDISAFDLQPVDVEDLLPRDKIEVDMQAASDLIKGNVVMITGAAGSIGSEMVRQIAGYGPAHLVLIDQAETPMHDIRLMMRSQWPDIKTETIVGDISDARMMERIFSQWRPKYVFHAAAYKHVPMMEDNPYQAVVNNVEGTKVIADLAVKYGTKKFVMVSTDKAVNPTNVMGCSKRICEIYVQSLDKAIKDGKMPGVTQFVTTRFGNVLGSNGSVIPIFQEQIRKGGPVTVTHPEIIRYFMLIPEACRLVIEAGTMGKGGEIYIFDMGKPVRIADLAKRMIKLSGAKNVKIEYTGLRDGEKLYEEVLNKEEVTLPTFHPKIKVAKVREYDYSDADAAVKELVEAARHESDMEIVARMKRMVPEFKSQHSKYEALDN